MSMSSTEFRTMLAGLPPDHPTRKSAEAQGLIIPATNEPTRPRKVPAKVEPVRVSRLVCCVEVEVEIRTQTECNTGDMPWDRNKRSKAQREAVDEALRPHVLPALPITVSLHRIGKRLLDAADNLPSSFKHPIDQIARMYGVEDNEPRITWATPTQEKADRFAVRIRIERRA